MAEFTEARLNECLAELREVFADGFQFSDLAMLVKVATEFVELSKLTGPEKRAAAVLLMERFIDGVDLDRVEEFVRRLDLPGPEILEDNVWDPILLKYAIPLLKDTLKAHLPTLIDLIVSATKGKLKINEPPPSGTVVLD